MVEYVKADKESLIFIHVDNLADCFGRATWRLDYEITDHWIKNDAY